MKRGCCQHPPISRLWYSLTYRCVSQSQLDTYLLDANLPGTSQTPLCCHHDVIRLATPLAASPSLSKQVFIYGHVCALVCVGRSGDNLQEPACSLHPGSPGIEFRLPGKVGQPTLLPTGSLCLWHLYFLVHRCVPE